MRIRKMVLYAVFLVAAQTPTIRVNTKLVQIRVVVRDKTGPVAGLKKEDFSVTDNGKPQPIEVFSAMDGRDRKQKSLGTMPPGVASNILDAAGEIPQSATAILLDLMNTSNEGRSTSPMSPGNATGNLTAITDEKEAIKQLVSYLRTIRAGDRVALFVLGSQLHSVQDFTGDPAILVRAAERLKALDLAGIEVSTQDQLVALLEPPPISNPDGSVTSVSVFAPFANAIAGISAINRASASADAFEAIARHMSGLPGRKNIVWLSAGFPFRPPTPDRKVGDAHSAVIDLTPDDFSAQLTRASKALTDANVAVYPVDYQGLSGAYPEVMKRIADATGGNVTYHTNDLKEAVSTAVADGDVSYTLGFYPADEKYDGKLHDLKVKVDRKDVDLHYRAGYYATANTLTDKERKDLVSELLGSDVNSSQIGVTASGLPDSAMPGNYNVTISVDATKLALPQKGDRRTGQLSLTMRLESSKSKTAQAGAIPLSFTEEQFQNILKRGFVIRQTVQAGRSDRLRIIVQDQTTGLAGALWLPLRSK